MRRFFAVLLPLLALSACDQPPTKEIAAAEAQIEQARQAGAERFAPDRWREALTNRPVAPTRGSREPALALADLFETLPLALVVEEPA